MSLRSTWATQQVQGQLVSYYKISLRKNNRQVGTNTVVHSWGLCLDPNPQTGAQ